MNTVKISQSNDNNAVCCVVIPNWLLEEWYQSRSSSTSYVSRLNSAIVGQALMVKQLDSVESRIKFKACKLCNSISKKSRRKKNKLINDFCKLTLYKGETEKPTELHDDWLCSIDDYRTMLDKKNDKIKELAQTITANNDGHRSINYGKGMHEVSDRQQRRKISQLRDSCEKALWFTDSYQINLKHVTFEIKSSGEEVSLSYPSFSRTQTSSELQSQSLSQLSSSQSSSIPLSQSSTSLFQSPVSLSQSSTTSLSQSQSSTSLSQSSSSQSSSSQSSSYQSSSYQSSSLSQSVVCNTLYLLDHYGVSDQFYHELSMMNPSLPRSYKIKQTRTEINSQVNITRLPSNDGWYRSVRDCIVDAIIAEVDDVDLLQTPVEVKISGDGAPFARSSNYVLLSISLPSLQSNLSSRGVHTVAAFRGSENYEELRDGFQPVLMEINNLISNRSVEVNGREVELNLYFVADYKFLLFMGMNAAHSKFACIYCHVEKDDRWDVSKVNEARTRDTMSQSLQNKSKGCIRPPLVDFNINSIIIDELHLMLRVTDVLLKSLVWTMVYMDIRDGHKDGHNVDLLVSAIRSCGVSFKVWLAKDGKGGRSTEHYDFTSLRGNDRQKLLVKFPPKIPSLLPGAEGERMKEIWEDFKSIMDMIGIMVPSDETIETLRTEVNVTLIYFKNNIHTVSFHFITSRWIQSFLSLSKILKWHQKKSVTPYMHIMAQHIPDLMAHFKGIKRFSGQPVEKNNDDARRNYRSSNKLDGAKEIMLGDVRAETLSKCQRVARPYNKRKAEYWEQQIYAKRNSGTSDEVE